jgi:hypothetical protein
MPRVLLACFALILSGCPDVGIGNDAATPDAGRPIDVTLPMWGECPAGWVRTADDGVSACAPPPRVSCEGSLFQRVGGTACEEIDPCPASRFSEDIEPDRTRRFVDAAAALAGDGTERAPFRSLDEALLDSVGPLAVVLAEGSYALTAPLPPDVSLHGVCAARVRIVGDASRPLVWVPRGHRVRISSLTLQGGAGGVLGRGDVVLRGVVIEGVEGVGVGFVGGSIDAERVLIRNTRAYADGTFGRGISIEAGAQARLRDVVVNGSVDAGIAVGASTLEGERVVVRYTAPNARGRYGTGVSGSERSQVTLRDTMIEHATEGGVVAEGGTTLVLQNVDIADVLSEATVPSGEGVEIRDSLATISHLRIQRSTGSGLVVSGASTAELSDVLIENIQPRTGFAVGLAALAGAVLTVQRAAIFHSEWAAVAVDGGRFVAQDLLIDDVLAPVNIGAGLLVRNGSGEIDRFRILHPQTVGIMLQGEGTDVRLAHGEVAYVAAGEAFDVGRGIEVDEGALADVQFVEVHDVIETGIVVYGGSTEGTRATLSHVSVHHIAERACQATMCASEGGGTGIAAVFRGAVQARDLRVDGAPLCGVQVAEGGAFEIESGSISNSAIGACVQIPGYDLDLLVRMTLFIENTRNIETTSLYVPPVTPAS